MQTWLFQQPEVRKFWPKLVAKVRHFIRKCSNGRCKEVTIHIGCHAGKQRSVTMVERLIKHIKQWKNVILGSDKQEDVHPDLKTAY